MWIASSHYLNARIYVFLDDTIIEIVDKTVGSATRGIVPAPWARRGRGARRRPAEHQQARTPAAGVA